ncbi:MAG: hypothetical protein SXU28_08360 [Pseudomonadota bacterium]|nr:hypothetical protein [Pseudomonadota bacterium]
MSEASFASLGPTLLARKGGAKPAMRPQLTALPQSAEEIAAIADEQLEDLGWNDMGSDEESAPSSESLVVSSKPGGPASNENAEEIIDPLETAEIVSINANTAPAPDNGAEAMGASPLVLRQQKRLADEIVGQAAEASFEAPVLEKKSDKKMKKKASRKKAKANSSKRAAFTLRLDADRHLKLRLAATMKGMSAQAFVTNALDLQLDAIADLDLLVERMQRS